MPARRESPYVVELRDIPPEGKQLALSPDADFVRAALADEPLTWSPSQLRVDVQLFKTGAEVVARGTLRGAMSTECSRCTAPSTQRLDETFDLTFVPAGRAAASESAGGGEHEMQPGEAELCTYVDEAIDLEAPLREQLILALPYAPLCKDDCRGLCPRCGKDLNEGPCECAGDAPDPVKPDRWAALKNIKL
jgi:uncharacterized protein